MIPIVSRVYRAPVSSNEWTPVGVEELTAALLRLMPNNEVGAMAYGFSALLTYTALQIDGYEYRLGIPSNEIRSALGLSDVKLMTQAEYDALPVKDANTFYAIVVP